MNCSQPSLLCELPKNEIQKLVFHSSAHFRPCPQCPPLNSRSQMDHKAPPHGLSSLARGTLSKAFELIHLQEVLSSPRTELLRALRTQPVNSHGTNVDVSAPTQRSLCFSLWLMYCRILKRGGENIRRLNRSMNSNKKHAHTPVHNQVSIIVAYAGPHVPEVSVGGLRVRPENFPNPARQGKTMSTWRRVDILVLTSKNCSSLTPFGRS